MFDDQELHETIQAFKEMGFSPQPEPAPFETAVPYRGCSQLRPAQA